MLSNLGTNYTTQYGLMESIRPLSLRCLSLLLVTAGCVTAPFDGPSDQEQPPQLLLNNSADETQTFEVWVADPQDNVTAQRDDGNIGNYTIDGVLSTRSSGEYHAWKEVELLGSARLHGGFTVELGEENRSAIEEFPRGYSVVVYQGDKSGWWASTNCGSRALVGLEVHTRPSQYGDAWAGYECR